LLKKTIEYEDFNGEKVTEEHYFHLSKAELVEMEMQHKGGMHDYLQNIVASEDGRAIIAEFKRLILQSFGERSVDGRRFIKSQELRDWFESSEAYSTLFMELCTDAEKAAEFINGIVPKDLEQDLAKLQPAEERPVKLAEPPRELSLQEATAMDGDELRSGIATGKYKLS
jgi:hypothetical protein